ncbi:MAG: BlaI/MecI/CopY family transcriptional regulator [Prevotellaceae bacterium]|jgi:predicted transcriptional regulator|nr:BlaI/MecI/CopY family transcriptional regulator [Prevotellaceae bacterium]
MKQLTTKEEEIMGFFWKEGPLFVKELLTFYDEPRPHFNTISTIVRILENKGFVSHETFGNTYRYFATISEEEFHKGTLGNVVCKYFNNSYLNIVSAFVEEEKISLEELRELIKNVRKS